MLQSVIRKAAKTETMNPLNQWIYRLYTQKGWNKTCMALANKNARIAWALVCSEEKFNPKKTAKTVNL